MTDVQTGPGDPGASEPARMSPLSRFTNVFFSPGAVFDDVRRDPRGWLVPLVIVALFVTAANMVYLAKFQPFQGDIVGEAMKSNAFLKMAPPEKQDEIIQDAVKMVNSIPLWQLEVQQISSHPFLKVLQAWFFTFLYALIALAMGWFLKVRVSKIFISAAIVGGILVVTAIASGVLQALLGSASKAGDGPPAWIALVGLLIGGGGAVVLFLGLRMLARQPEVERIVSVVCLAMAPLVIWSLAAVIISVVKTPDPTSVDELVPSSLGLLAGMKDGALGALLGQLDLFRLWILGLATVGLARVFGKSIGAAAAIVFGPWIVWVLCVVAIGAITSSGS